VLRYLRRIVKYGLWYKRIEGLNIQGFTYVDWARSPSDRKSTLGVIFSVGFATISWYIRKKRSMALITVEAKYIVASQETCETYG